MLGNTVSPRDDLIQVVYSLIFLHSKFLPLYDFLGDDPLGMKFWDLKVRSSAYEFCDLNETLFMKPVLEECYRIGYDETPDYSKITFLLKQILLDVDVLPGGIYYKAHQLLDDEDPGMDELSVPDDDHETNFNPPSLSYHGRV